MKNMREKFTQESIQEHQMAVAEGWVLTSVTQLSNFHPQPRSVFFQNPLGHVQVREVPREELHLHASADAKRRRAYDDGTLLLFSTTTFTSLILNQVS